MIVTSRKELHKFYLEDDLNQEAEERALGVAPGFLVEPGDTAVAIPEGTHEAESAEPHLELEGSGEASS